MSSSSMSSNVSKLLFGSLLIGSCAILIIATFAQAQYNTYDSDSNSELGKLVRGSARGGRNSLAGAQHHHHNSQQHQQQHNLAATRNLYNRQQPMQHAQTHNYRQSSFGGRGDTSDADGDDSGIGAGYNPASLMGAASHGRQGGSNADNDDDEGANFGPNFDSNVDSDESSQVNGGADGQPMNLNQAASGYPGYGSDASEGSGANYGGSSFGGSGAYGPSSFEGSDFGPSEGGFAGGEGRRAKSASSLMGMRNFGAGGDEDAGAPQYGPNSAINAGGSDDDDSRANYAPEATSNDNDNDDE